MRLKAATIEGFRGFAGRFDVDLDADVILLQGQNGGGKTSLLDAVLWAITGKIERFGNRGSPVSLYAREGTARVSLTMRDQDQDLAVTRVTDGENTSVRLDGPGLELEGPQADARMAEYLLPHSRGRAGDETNPLSDILTRGVYLQQDLLRQFVEADSDADRFSLISEIIGAGTVLDLQSTLERSRNQWARNLNALRKETLEPIRQQITRIDEQLRHLASESADETLLRESSAELYAEAIAVFGRGKITLHEAPSSSSALDRLLRELAAERARIERELTVVRGVLEEAKALQLAEDKPLEQSVAELEQLENKLQREIESNDAMLAAQRAALADRQQLILSNQDRLTRLANMAQLALSELGEHCPVCQQVHNIEATAIHLRALIAAAESPPADTVAEERAIAELSRAGDSKRGELAQVRTRLNDAKGALSDRQARKSVHAARLRDLAVSTNVDSVAVLTDKETQLRSQIEKMDRLLRRGEQLSVSVVRLGEQRKRNELLQERANLHPKLEQVKRETDKMEVTHTIAGRIIDGLRQASLEVTRREIERLSPLFQRIYSRIDPHPTFRVTQLAVAMERGKGLLRTGVVDPEQGDTMHDALPLLSSSQLNSFAVSLFLSMNLGLPSLRLQLMMLDDPLQSLDSINLLGLVDVLRRVRQHRQIIVSTHEAKLLGLLQRKLRPVRSDERMMTLVFEGWTRQGPSVRMLPMVFDREAKQVLAA